MILILECLNCGKYLFSENCEESDEKTPKGNERLKCPECGETHFAVVEEGKVQSLERFVEYGENSGRGLMGMEGAVRMLKLAGVGIMHDSDHVDYCPYCGADAEDSKSPLTNKSAEKYILNPHIKIAEGWGDDEPMEKIPYTIPLMKNRATGVPIFLVGINNMIEAVASLKLGDDYERPDINYMGTGKQASYETAQNLKQLKEYVGEEDEEKK